jgi:glycosyltransferase involved in cell wall biosynthesis
MEPKITIAVCTYNRKRILQECLYSLRNQKISQEIFNIIVVDNNSSDGTADFVQNMLMDWTNAKYIFEPIQGLSHARNRALGETKTAWLAFLDDDAKARNNWIETILTTISKNDFDAFGGPYYAWYHFGQPPHWRPDTFDTYVAEQGYGPLQGATYIPGGNCAIRVSAARECGGFAQNLGMVGKTCAYGEETALFKTMKASRYRLGYVPHMIIDHCVCLHKYKLVWQIQSLFARGRAKQRISPEQKPLMLLRYVYKFLKVPLNIIRQSIHSDNKVSFLKLLFYGFTSPLFYSGVIFERYFGEKRND